MHPFLEDLKYRGGNLLSDIRYKVQELAATPTGRIKLGAASVAGLVVVIVLGVGLSRLLAPPPPEPAILAQAKTNTVGASSWVTRAREALAGNDRFAGIEIEPRSLAGKKQGVRVSGTVPDMAALLEAKAILGELGVPENLELDLVVDPASLEKP